MQTTEVLTETDCCMSLCLENMKKVTLFVTRCDIEIGVNYPCHPYHRLALLHFELTL